MKSENEILNKILKCCYIIIALLAINTVILIATNVDTSTTSSDEEATEETENTEYDVSMFNTVDVDKVIDLYDSKKTEVIYLGRSTCGYCVKFLPMLQEAQDTYGYTTNYLDITTVSSDEKDELLKHDNDEKFLAENYGSTPMVLLVKDGEIKDTWVGYSEYDEFAQFLENNGFEED